MRHKRAKIYKKAMGVYINAFNFRQPFQILGERRVEVVRMS